MSDLSLYSYAYLSITWQSNIFHGLFAYCVPENTKRNSINPGITGVHYNLLGQLNSGPYWFIKNSDLLEVQIKFSEFCWLVGPVYGYRARVYYFF
jgi:hypothetical protein